MFQGGGARVAALLAVGHLLQEYVKSGKIQLGRVAGTSAGAIVAALLASGADLALVRADLLRVGDDGFARAFPRRGLFRYAWAAYRDEAFYNISFLRELLSKPTYNLAGRTVQDFTTPELQITVADVTTGRKVVKGTANVVDTILDSCALPFVFRTASHLVENPHLDGGLCENLPADTLLADRATHGDVVAVSFAEPATRSHPTNALELASSLLELAIDNSVRRAARDVGEESVHRVRTKLTTFSFDTVCRDGLADDPYERVKGDARRWLDTWLATRATSRRSAYAGMPTDELMRRVDLVYRSLETDVEFLSSSMVVTAHCVGGHRDGEGRPLPDQVDYITQIKPRVPLRCLKQSLGATTGTLTRDSEWVVQSDDGRSITDFVAIPSRDSAIDAHFQSTTLFFATPLEANRTFVVRRRESISMAMAALANGKPDYLSNMNTRQNVAVGTMVLIVQVPDSHYVVHNSYDKSDVQGAVLDPQQISKIVPGVPHGGFSAFGWRAENVPPMKRFRAYFTAVPVERS